jgi:predicted small secreted protein
MRKLHLLPVLMLALAFGLAACGCGESDEDKIATTIENAATNNDPAVCDETQTLAFMEQTSGSSGKEAEEVCEENARHERHRPDSVNVTSIEVAGDEATANAGFQGGNLDGQTLEVALVEEDGDWKLDEFTGFAKFNLKRLVNVFAKPIEADRNVKPRVASCIVEGIEGLSKSELESLAIEYDFREIGEITEGCE